MRKTELPEISLPDVTPAAVAESPQAVTPREVLIAYLRSRAWAERRDTLASFIRPRIVEELLTIADKTVRRADLRGRLDRWHPDYEVEIADLCGWIAEANVPHSITPTVCEWATAVAAKAEMLRRHNAELNDLTARVTRLRARIMGEATARRDEAHKRQVQTDLAKELAARDQHLAQTRRGREVLKQRGEIRAGIEAAADAKRAADEAEEREQQTHRHKRVAVV